jgi:hypothetical protein
LGDATSKRRSPRHCERKARQKTNQPRLVVPTSIGKTKGVKVMAVVIGLLLEDFALLTEVVDVVSAPVVTRVRDLQLNFAQLMEVVVVVNLMAVARAQEVVLHFAKLMEVGIGASMRGVARVRKAVLLNFARRMEVVTAVNARTVLRLHRVVVPIFAINTD